MGEFPAISRYQLTMRDPLPPVISFSTSDMFSEIKVGGIRVKQMSISEVGVLAVGVVFMVMENDISSVQERVASYRKSVVELEMVAPAAYWVPTPPEAV
jgi:hypothetical protein